MHTVPWPAGTDGGRHGDEERPVRPHCVGLMRGVRPRVSPAPNAASKPPVLRGPGHLGLDHVSCIPIPKPASRVIHAHHYRLRLYAFFQMWQESQNLHSDFT
eukprot:1935402-Prymnesium_polylepis.1